MTLTIWNKYKKIKELDKNSNIKTYLARIEPVIKEISYKNKNEYLIIIERIERIKNKIKIYDIIEEENKIYLVIDNNNEIISEIDNLILKDEIILKKEGLLKGQGNPVSKNEIIELFNMEKSMCKIIYEKIVDNEIKKGKASGFLCEIYDFPIKYGLFTNNHVLNENDIKKGNIINLEFLNESSYIKKKIIIDEKRRVYTDKELDYTCIEIYQSDGFKYYFKIDPILFNNKNCLKNTDIFILQYPEGNELCFSYGKILSLKDNNIIHSASTKDGSSGSPIIRRSEDNYIIGLHHGGIKKEKNIDCSFNLATNFDSILNDINKLNGLIKQDRTNQNEIYHSIKEDNGNLPDETIKQEKMNIEKILPLVGNDTLPDIMNFANGGINENKFNNIIYYDPDINYLSNINQDIDEFEKETPGAFIVCTNFDSFKLISTELSFELKKDSRLSFNLITTGDGCEKVIHFLKEDSKFKICIKNVCVYCPNIQKWSYLKDKYDLIYDVVSSKKEVINFIKIFSSKNIKPYHIAKVITINDYLEKYKDKHIKISQFYGDLNPQTFEDNIKKMRSLIEKEDNNHELKKDHNMVFDGFLTFELRHDLKILDKLIIKEYSGNKIYADLNKWLRNPNFNSFEVVAYFAARLMYSLNNYANKEDKYFDLDKTDIYGGMKLPFSNVLAYERAKGKIIVLSAFTSTYQELIFAQRYSGRKHSISLYEGNLKFSVIFIIKNNLKKKWISNGIRIYDVSQYKKDKEILFQPFSFYYVRDVQISQKDFTADIYLETIGKKEILEEKIKLGKEIKYNEKENIMEVK